MITAARESSEGRHTSTDTLTWLRWLNFSPVPQPPGSRKGQHVVLITNVIKLPLRLRQKGRFCIAEHVEILELVHRESLEFPWPSYIPAPTLSISLPWQLLSNL